MVYERRFDFFFAAMIRFEPIQPLGVTMNAKTIYDPENILATWKVDPELKSWQKQSPNGRFEIRYSVGGCQPIEPYSLEFGKAEIYDTTTDQLEAVLVRDHYTEPTFDWFTRDEQCILIWASTYLRGYEVVDLENQSLMHVEINKDEEFIWLECLISPSQTKIAVTGCYWVCPYELKVFDLPNLKNEDIQETGFNELAATSYESGKLSWIDDQTVVTIDDDKEINRLTL